MPDPLFSANDFVVIRDGDGQPGVVVSEQPEMLASQFWYRVRFGNAILNCREQDLSVYTTHQTLEELLSSDSFGGPDSFRRHLTAIKLKERLTDTLYSFGASRTRLYPYQFIPLLKYIASPYRRILIADEVGLGKTIEAGYILQEELARSNQARVLIICPASLRLKWQDELLNRFSHRFEILNAGQARDRLPRGDFERRTGTPLRAIVSLQSIRNQAFLDTVSSSDCPFDLVILDEAHHCRNAKTLQAKAVSAVMEQSDSAVFLTATPIQTNEMNLFNLLNILVPEEFPSKEGFEERLLHNRPIVEAETLLRQPGKPQLRAAAKALESLDSLHGAGPVSRNPAFRKLVESLQTLQEDTVEARVDLQEQLSQINLLSNVFTRTKRRDVHIDVAQRKSVIAKQALSLIEQDAYDRVTGYLFEQYRRLYDDNIARLVLTTYQRQLASSIPASIRKFQTEDPAGPIEDEIESIDDFMEIVDGTLRYRPHRDPHFLAIVNSLDADQLERHDTKFNLLLESLRQQSELVRSGERRSDKIIVFSYFRRSLDYLERRLRNEGYELVRIDGSVKSTPGNPETDERKRRIDRFRGDAEVVVMLTSEVGSEGLDFQFCDAMVNWDLPWNPMAIEQRIGRIDRIGQLSPTIHIINLACSGTIEERILTRLFDRIGIFERSIGELEPILGAIVQELERELFNCGLSEERQARVLEDKRNVIETSKRHWAKLESEAEALIGHDAFFLDKLDRIQRFGRYVGGPELEQFMNNELQQIIAGFRFVADSDDGVYLLEHRPEIENTIRNALPKSDQEALRFLERYRSGRARFTFTGAVADEYPDVEPLHAQHPLVRALTLRMGDSYTDRQYVASLQVASDAVPPGAWFFLWSLVHETGFLKARSLMCCVVDLAGEELKPVGIDAGDQLLADMLRNGQPWTDFTHPDLADASTCLQAARGRMIERIEQRSRTRHERMTTIKESRKGTIEATYELRISRQRARLDELEYRSHSDDGAKRILPALRGRLNMLEAEREARIDEIDALKEGTVSFSELGAGFVHVVENPNEGARR